MRESVFWFGAWMCFLLLMIFPTSLDFFIRDILDLGRRLDFFIVIGFMFLIGVVFHTYTIVRKSQNRIDKLVRKMAIEKENKK